MNIIRWSRHLKRLLNDARNIPDGRECATSISRKRFIKHGKNYPKISGDYGRENIDPALRKCGKNLALVSAKFHSALSPVKVNIIEGALIYHITEFYDDI